MSVRTMCIIRPLLQPLTAAPVRPIFSHPQQHARAFFSNPFDSSSSPPSTLSATRTLPYPTLRVYDMISDIESYPTFVPYCRAAKITSWSSKDAHHARSWPQEATLTIGFGSGVEESFASRVFCAPPVPEKGRAGVGIVEAVSGEAKATTGVEEGHVEHHDTSRITAQGGNESPLTYLKTRWTVTNFPYKAPADGKEGGTEERTDVALTIEYKFANPMYEVMSKAVAGKVAEKMIEAFEKRAQSLLGGK